MPPSSKFRIFIGAPSSGDLDLSIDEKDYNWETVSSYTRAPCNDVTDSEDWLPPPATLEAASRAISLVCKNVTFEENEDESERYEQLEYDDNSHTVSREETTVITWAPSPNSLAADLQQNMTTGSFAISRKHSVSVSRLPSMYETQETGSYVYSDTSSIARFPCFNLRLHSLTSLATLLQYVRSGIYGTRKTNFLVAVLEVEGPDTIIIKKGPDSGKEATLLKFIVGDETGSICKLTAWRETADRWGGRLQDVTVLRGDVVALENVLATYAPSATPFLTASPKLNSRLDICFRTMPHTVEDRVFRPDLRLGDSDAAVRKVSATVRWFQGLAGLS